jgi:hypothetical protein
MPPIIAKGTVIKTSPASIAFPNVINNKIKISSIQRGTTWISLVVALTWLSNSPVQIIEYPFGNFIFFFITFCESLIVLPKSLYRIVNLTAIKRLFKSR